MLDTQITVQIIISICVGLSYLAINHYKVFVEVKRFINRFILFSVMVYFINYLFWSTNTINFKTLLFEVILISFPYLYYSMLTYIGYLIEKNKNI